MRARAQKRKLKAKRKAPSSAKQESIQVCFEGEGWEEYVEVLSGSAILKPFREWEIECLGADLDDSGRCRPIIRVSLREA